MLKKMTWLLAAALMAGGQMATAEGLKIGFVSATKLVEAAPQAKEAMDRLQKEFAPREKELLARQKSLREREESFIKDSSILSQEQRQKKEREIITAQREFKLAETQFKEDFAARRGEELAKVQESLRTAIQAIGAEEGYDLILYEGVSYASAKVDITDKVVKKLQSKK